MTQSHGPIPLFPWTEETGTHGHTSLVWLGNAHVQVRHPRRCLILHQILREGPVRFHVSASNQLLHPGWGPLSTS